MLKELRQYLIKYIQKSYHIIQALEITTQDRI